MNLYKQIMAVPIANARRPKDEEEIFLKTISTRIGGGSRIKSAAPTVSDAMHNRQ
jgi:hypothetical protein